MRWLAILVSFALIFLTAGAIQTGPGRLLGPEHWADKVDQWRGSSQQMLLDSQFRRASSQEGPQARLGRVAQDYVYRLPDQPDDERLLRRMLSDNLIPLETYRGDDGTAAVLLKDLKTGQVIIAFRGTTGKVRVSEDWLRNEAEAGAGQSIGTVSYAQHHRVFDRWIEVYGGQGKIVVTGHSRGGGLAQIFTSFHGDRVGLTVTYQSPGVDEMVHQRYLKTPWEQRGQHLAFVADNDPVADVGGDHLGSPDVLLFTGKDTQKPESFAGHTACASQPEGLTDSEGRLYRQPGDDRRLLELDYALYKTQVRGGALLEVAKKGGWVREGMSSAPVDRSFVYDAMRRNGMAPEHSDWRKKAKKSSPEGPASEPKNAVLRATVRDQETLEALAQARLEAEDGTFVLTGQDGTASLDLPKPQKGDQALVRVSRNGYKPRRGSVRIKEGVARAAVSLEPVLKVRLGGPTRSATAVNCTYQVSVEGGKSPYRYTWLLDGTRQQASSEQVSMVWTKPGDHVLAVEVVEGGGNSRFKRLPVTVEAGKLEVEMSGPTRVTVSDQSEYQVEIAGGKPPYRMQWFLNGERANVQEDRISVVMTWAKVNPGAYQLRAVVTDAVGVVAQAEKSIQLEGFKVSASGPRQAVVGQQSQYRVSASGGKPPYSYQWFLNGAQQNADGEAISVTWKNPGRCPLRIIVADASGARAEVADTIEVSPPTPEQSSTPPSEGAYIPVVGTYSGQIEKRMPDKSLRPYPGLSLAYDGKNVGGVMRCGRDQGMLLDMRWKGTWKNLRIQGVSQRKLSGEIQGTVNGVHPVQGGFLVSEVQAQSWRGSWYVNFQNGEKWSGRFQVSR